MLDFANERALFADVLSTALPPEVRNLPTLLERAAQRNPEKTLVRFDDNSWTRVQCRNLVARTAGMLKNAGIKPGDRVAIMVRNRLEFITAFVGCMWLGAIVVPINIALRGAQFAHALNLSQSRLLIIDGNLLEHLQLVPPTPHLTDVWSLDDVALPARKNCRVASIPPLGTPMPLRTIDHGEPAAILFTSGTTGPSKGATCPAAQFYWWGVYQSAAMLVKEDSVIFNSLPLFHINALNTFTQALTTGATCVLAERFSASQFWRRVCEVEATHIAIIGAMANILLAQPASDWDTRHRVSTLFASSVTADAWAAFSARFKVGRRVGGYGATESNLCFNSQGGWEVQGNMGLVTNGFEAAVFGESDLAVPDGTPGELVLRSNVPFAFALGYWGMPEATLSSFRNQWLHTGDRVVREPDGRFRFVGRLKESIRRRGENISAWEVEQAILTHDAIAQTAVFGIPSEFSGEEVMAAIVLKRGAARPAHQDLIRHLEPRLARFAIPRYLEFVDELPLTDTGKIRRWDLRERGVTGATWDREHAAASP